MFLAESLNTGRGLFVFSLDLCFFLSSSAGELIWDWDGSPSNLKSTWWRVPYPLTEADKNKIHSCDTDEKTKAQDGKMIRSRRHTLKINLPRALCFFPCSLPLWKEIQTLLVQGSLFTCSLAFLDVASPAPGIQYLVYIKHWTDTCDDRRDWGSEMWRRKGRLRSA